MMKRSLGILLTAIFFSVAVAPNLNAQEGPVQSLRGATAIDETAAVPDVRRQDTPDHRFRRSYRQQPPLIPHKMNKYQINLKVNQCLGCHNWPYNVDAGAPKISETHYMSREGAALDVVARTRWFCTQCHVPQVRTRALVPNTFKSPAEID